MKPWTVLSLIMLCSIKIVNGLPKVSSPSMSEFDVYTNFPFQSTDDETSHVIPSTPVTNIFSTITRSLLHYSKTFLENTSSFGNIGGLVYLGFQLYTFVKSKSNNHRLSAHVALNVSSIEKLEKEYDELWGIIHGLHKKNNEKLNEFETKKIEFQSTVSNDLSQLHSQLKEIEKMLQNYNSNSNSQISQINENVGKLDKEWGQKETQLLSKLEVLSQQMLQLTKEVSVASKASALTSTTMQTQLTLIQSNADNISKISAAMNQIKEENQHVKSELTKFQSKDVPALFKEYETMTLNKLQKFGENIKKLLADTSNHSRSLSKDIKKSNSATSGSSSSGSKPNSSKPKK